MKLGSPTDTEIEEIMGMSLPAMRMVGADNNRSMARLLRLAFAHGCLTGQRQALRETNEALHRHVVVVS